MNRYLPLLATLLLLPACTSHLQQKENYLRQAGFRPVTPTTPSQIARAKAMPQGHIQKVTRNGKQIYSMARVSEQDPDEVLADAWWDFVRPSRGSGPEKFTFTARNTVTNERCTTSVRA